MEQATLLLIYELLAELVNYMMLGSLGLVVGVVVISLTYDMTYRQRTSVVVALIVVALVAIVLSEVALTLGWDNIHEGSRTASIFAFFTAGGMAITGAILYRGEIPTADEANNDTESPDDQ